MSNILRIIDLIVHDETKLGLFTELLVWQVLLCILYLTLSLAHFL